MATMLGITGDQPTLFDDPTLGHAEVSSAVQAVVVWFGAGGQTFFPPELRMVHALSTAQVLPPFLIANGEADPHVSARKAQQLHTALLKVGATSTLTIIPGAAHEDPAFVTTQMVPTFAFLDKTFGR